MVVYVKGNALAAESELTELKGIMRKAASQRRPPSEKQNAATAEATAGTFEPES